MSSIEQPNVSNVEGNFKKKLFFDKVGKENSTNIKIGILLAVGENLLSLLYVIHLHSTTLKFSMNYWLSFVTKPRLVVKTKSFGF